MEVVLGSNKLLHKSDVVDCSGHPWLIVCDDRKKERIFFFNFIERRYFFVSIPNSYNMYFWFCGNGRLFFENYDHSGDNFLFNLISMETLQLPPLLEVYSDRKSCILTAPPTDPNCRVILIESCTDHLFLWESGQDNFIKETLIIDQLFDIITATSFNGMIYALVSPGYGLAKANYTNPGNFEILWTGLPIKTPWVCKSFFYLVEVDGELLFVNQPMMGDGCDGVLDFIIYKADFQDMKWVKVDNINDNAIFLNEHQGFACSVKDSQIKRNSIYFSLIMDRDFYKFDLEDKSVMMLPTCNKISMRHSELYWVMLPC